MDLQAFFETLQDGALASSIRESTMLYPILLSTHLMGMGLFGCERLAQQPHAHEDGGERPDHAGERLGVDRPSADHRGHEPDAQARTDHPQHRRHLGQKTVRASS